jgi:hypothetical protein
MSVVELMQFIKGWEYNPAVNGATALKVVRTIKCYPNSYPSIY